MPMLYLLFASAISVQAAQTPQTPSAPAPPKPTQLDLRVTDRSGMLLDNAHVTAEGPSSRDGATDHGAVSFKNLTAGTYRLRIERDGYVTLEKDVTVKAGVGNAAEAALTAAPPPPPPPPAPTPVVVAAPAPVLTAGPPSVASIPDLADGTQRLGSDASKETPLGCSGATAARLLQARDVINGKVKPDADETLYLVAGEGTLHLAGKDYVWSAGSFAMVPRGSDYSIGRRGKNPIIVLSTINGPVCGK